MIYICLAGKKNPVLSYHIEPIGIDVCVFQDQRLQKNPPSVMTSSLNVIVL
jgi:hypothetical protein